MGRIQRQLYVGLIGTGNLTKHRAGDRGDVFKVTTIDRRYPLTTNEIFVTVGETNRRTGSTGGWV